MISVRPFSFIAYFLLFSSSSFADTTIPSEATATPLSVWLPLAQNASVYFVMNKEQSVLRVHSLQDGKLYGQFRAISGLNSGDKEREGDKKTPEGVYFVTSKIPKSRLQALHGPAAYELNYPNVYDRIKKHTGSGIWIHGVEKEDRLQKGTDTLGCIALSNTDILELGKLLRFGETPVIVTDRETPGQSLGLETPAGAYAQRLHAWATAWSSKDAESYLSFYHDEFQSRGMKLADWKAYKTRLAKTYKKIEVKLEGLRIFVHGKYAVAVFDQNYSSDRFQSSSRKRIYFAGPASEAKIFSEEVVMERDLATVTDNLTLSQHQ